MKRQSIQTGLLAFFSIVLIVFGCEMVRAEDGPGCDHPVFQVQGCSYPPTVVVSTAKMVKTAKTVSKDLRDPPARRDRKDRRVRRVIRARSTTPRSTA